MSRAIEHYMDRERPVEEGRMDETKPAMTTGELRDLVDYNIKHGHGRTKLGATAIGLGAAYSQCLPIAEERDALRAEVERLRHLRDAIIEDHEECSQYRNWLANPARVGRCHVCDLLHSEATP